MSRISLLLVFSTLAFAAGKPLDGTVSLRACVYVGGAKAWCDFQRAVAVRNGVFSIELKPGPRPRKRAAKTWRRRA